MPISTKELIIDATIDLISKNGYAETSIRDIAQYVGIKTSTIYYYFESKEAIFDYILNHIVDEYIKIIREDEHRLKWHEEKYSIIAGEVNLSAEEIMHFMFFKFDEQHRALYRKMVKIICSEAVRNDTASNYFRYQNHDSFIYIKSVLDTLLKAGEISKSNTIKSAGVLYSIAFAFMHFDSIDIQYMSKDDESIGMFSLLEYVLKIVVEGLNK